jgi:hypothetical protein
MIWNQIKIASVTIHDILKPKIILNSIENSISIKFKHESGIKHHNLNPIWQIYCVGISKIITSKRNFSQKFVPWKWRMIIWGIDFLCFFHFVNWLLNTYLHFEIQLYSNQWCSFCRESYTNTFNNISVISWLSILFVDLPNGMKMLMKIYHACLQQLKQNKIMF